MLPTDIGNMETPTRNNYFYGKLMDVCHFQMEQDYHNQKRWLLNRFSFGHGVLCGLEVVIDPDDASRIRVTRGAAMDGLGREIIVPRLSRAIDPRQRTDEQGRPSGDPVDSGTVTICLAYHECMADMVPVLVGDCKAECAASTIQERYVIQVRDEAPQPAESSYNFEDILSEGGSIDYEKLLECICMPMPCPDVSDNPCVVLAQVELPLAEGKISTDARQLACRNALLFELILFLLGKVT